jgi:hypothetical protein
MGEDNPTEAVGNEKDWPLAKLVHPRIRLEPFCTGS